MAEWAQVRWTEAHQVVALQTNDPEALPADGVSPHDHYRALRDAGERDQAVAFLALALPRFEAIAWAVTIVDQEAAGRRLHGNDRQALDYALRWLGDANDERRRAAFDAAEQAGERSPERVVAMAVFFSGGSISLPDLPPVLPRPEAGGQVRRRRDLPRRASRRPGEGGAGPRARSGRKGRRIRTRAFSEQ